MSSRNETRIKGETLEELVIDLQAQIADMSHALLKTVELISSLSEVEQKFEWCKDSSQEEWFSFKDRHRIYKKKRGIRPISELIEDNAATHYCRVLKLDDLDEISEFQLITMIDKHHKIDLDGWSLLNELKMEPSNVYNRTKVELYSENLSVIIKKYPQILTELGEAVVSKYFFNQLQPPELADLMRIYEPQSIDDALKKLINKLSLKDIKLSLNSFNSKSYQGSKQKINNKIKIYNTCESGYMKNETYLNSKFKINNVKQKTTTNKSNKSNNPIGVVTHNNPVQVKPCNCTNKK